LSCGWPGGRRGRGHGGGLGRQDSACCTRSPGLHNRRIPPGLSQERVVEDRGPHPCASRNGHARRPVTAGIPVKSQPCDRIRPTPPKRSNLASGLHPNAEPATPPWEPVLDSWIHLPRSGSGPMQVYLWNCVIASRSRLDAMPSFVAALLAVRPGGTSHGIGPESGGNDFPPRACSSGQDGTFISSRRPVVFTGRSHGPKWCRKGQPRPRPVGLPAIGVYESGQ
jgi:hypothetical protein